MQEFLDDSKGVLLIDFYATYNGPSCRWCGPCKNIAPLVSELSEEYCINVAKIDVDCNGSLAAQYQIQAMPTFKLIRDTLMNHL